jgi:hypothetical protein
MHNSVYAFDTTVRSATATLWRTNLGASVPSDHYNFNDIYPEVGILSTPVIDAAGGTMYLVANTLENNQSVYRLHALDITTGAEKLGGPVVIQASVPGTASDGHNATVAFNAEQQLQRPGLLLLNGVVYIGFGSHGDDFPYHGWLLGYDATNIQRQVTTYNSTPNGLGGSFWQSGRGIAADADGFVYPVAANGDYDGVENFGESFLRLDTHGGLSVSDWFTTSRWATLNSVDQEVGAAGAILVPGSDLIVGADKVGFLYLIHANGMGRFADGDTEIVQKFQAVSFGLFSMALWNRDGGPLVYVSGWSDTTKAYPLAGGKLQTTPDSQTPYSWANGFCGMAVSADGGKDGTGILWLTTADIRDQPVPGTLRAFDASDLSHELWSSGMNPARDSLGNFAKFATPTVADGKVFVPTHSDMLAVYGLLSDPMIIRKPHPRRPRLPGRPDHQTP